MDRRLHFLEGRLPEFPGGDLFAVVIGLLVDQGDVGQFLAVLFLDPRFTPQPPA